MPSQKQLKWSQLKVGITVLAASITLAILILLMSGTGGIFTHKITLISYFDNAGGLREGAPVRLQGVDVGNVTKIMVVPDPSRQLAPVRVVMKIITKYHQSVRTDSVTTLSTAGVLGETYIDIDSSRAKGPEAQDGAVLGPASHRRLKTLCAPAKALCKTWIHCSSAPTALSPLSKAARDRLASSSTMPPFTTS